MKIELGESDGFLYEDDKAKNIIVTIDGKFSFPFSAEKSIADLYEAVKKINLKKELTPAQEAFADLPLGKPMIDGLRIKNVIQRNDYVFYTGPANPDNPDLIPNNEYRVMIVHKKDKMASSYEIISDTMPTPIRLSVPFSSVALSRKSTFVYKPPNNVFEEIFKCDSCQEDSVLKLDKESNKYKGVCINCNKALEKERPKVKV